LRKATKFQEMQRAGEQMTQKRMEFALKEFALKILRSIYIYGIFPAPLVH
jgi:hypothetical protein